MSNPTVSLTLLGAILFTFPCMAQNQNGPPPPLGMTAGEYLQRYSRPYNPYTGYDPSQDLERNRQLFETPKQYAPPSQTGNFPPASPTPKYSGETGRFEVPCTAAVSSDAIARLNPVYNTYSGKYEVPCERKR